MNIVVQEKIGTLKRQYSSSNTSLVHHTIYRPVDPSHRGVLEPQTASSVFVITVLGLCLEACYVENTTSL